MNIHEQLHVDPDDKLKQLMTSDAEYSDMSLEELSERLDFESTLSSVTSIDAKSFSLIRTLSYYGVLYGYLSFQFSDSRTLTFLIRSTSGQDYLVASMGYLFPCLHIEGITYKKSGMESRSLFFKKSKKDLDFLNDFCNKLHPIIVDRLLSYIGDMGTFIGSLLDLRDFVEISQIKYLWSVLSSTGSLNISPTTFYDFLSPEFTPFQEYFIYSMNTRTQSDLILEAYRIAGFANPFNGADIVRHIDRIKNHKKTSYKRLHEEMLRFVNYIDDDHDKFIYAWEKRLLANFEKQQKDIEEKNKKKASNVKIKSLITFS